MAIYKYTDFFSGAATTYTFGAVSPATPTTAFLTSDTFTFDNDTLSASDITSLTELTTGSGVTAITTTTLVINSKTIIFKNFALDKIAKTNFIFADGSQLIVGDGTSTVSTVGTTAADNVLYSTEFNDYMDGLGGNDTASYLNATSAVTVSLAATSTQITGGAGIDKLLNIENLTGSNYADTLTGNSGANKLDGGLGMDTLSGGDGNDTYTLTSGDTVTETVTTPSSNADKVFSGFDYALPTNVEQLELSGSTAIYGTGNASANTITGNMANNVLDGGAGADELIGGVGNDTYFVDTNAGTTTAGHTGDFITEIATVGTADLVVSTVTFSLFDNGTNVENLRLMAGAINGTGNDLDNIIYAGSGVNDMDGGDNGTVVMDGGTNDTVGDTLSYQYASGKVTVTLGTATLSTAETGAANAALGDQNQNFESLTGGSYADTLTGNSSTNTISGGLGNDTISGGAGTTADKLLGGYGDDTYVLVDNSADIIIELTSQGTDTVSSGTLNVNISAASAALSKLTTFAYLENVTLTGSTVLTGTGNSGNNVMTGNSVASTLIGGTGNDTYVVSFAGTNITEISSGGLDVVQSGVSYDMRSLALNVENLTLTGSAAINGTGNASANIITGNSGANKLDGSTGKDKLIGGNGVDTYVVDDAGDYVDETTGTTGANAVAAITANAALDTVWTSVTYTITDTKVENLTLADATGVTTGTSAISGYGNSSANIITGNNGDNTLYGAAGNDKLIGNTGKDTLDGGTGADTMQGGTGADTYIVDNLSDTADESTSTDTAASPTLVNATGDLVKSSVTYTLGANIENLTLTGTAVINGTGNAAANIITGNDSKNILDGIGGNDQLAGGKGDDTYLIHGVGDSITENSNSGTDLVQAGFSYTLGNNLENLALTSTGVLDTNGLGTDTVAINGTGNALDNTIKGNAGVNILDGGTGADILVGGAGNDIYIIDNVSDKITENANEGSDTVGSSIFNPDLTKFINVENVWIYGTAALTGTGNALANVLFSDNTNAASTLVGGAGDDIYVLTTSTTTITEASGTTAGVDLVQTSVSYDMSLLATTVENLTLTGATALTGTGNTLDNTITGNNAASTLKGMAGSDTYVVSNSATVVSETGSTDAAASTTVTNAAGDLVLTSVTYTLTDANVENLTLTGATVLTGTGNASANIMTGNNAASTLAGAAGDDVYVVSNASTIVSEAAIAGTDLVQASVNYTLLANVENLTLTGASILTGTGNTLANTMTGNNAASTLKGMAGSDTYVVSNSATVVSETGSTDPNANATAANAAGDLVLTSVTYTLTDTNVENLTLTGTTALTGTGNLYANIMTGNNAASTLAGAAGDDVYVVSNASTIVSEAAGAGNDLVNASVTYTLPTNVEYLTLTGTATGTTADMDSINGIGNTLANTIVGNAGPNQLDGGTGTGDILRGGAGSDTYVVDATGDTVDETSSTDAAASATLVNATGDLVNSSATYTLGTNIENLTLTGTAVINGTGNAAANIITGNAANNSLTGGAGADKFVFTAYTINGTDTITDFTTTSDDLSFSAVDTSIAATGTTILAGAKAPLVNHAVDIITTSGAAGSLTTGSSTTLAAADLTAAGFGKVATYLNERFTVASGDNAVFVLNSTITGATNKAYAYEFHNAADTTLAGTELTLIGIITGTVAAGDIIA
jgi:Ca2+-binding RTX toxin-like protein